jgi:hypothetical protein
MVRYSIEFKNQPDKPMVIGYENRQLALISIPEWFSEQQITWMLNTVPTSEPRLGELDSYMPRFKVQKIEEDLSFERFWNDYGYKVGKKERCQMLWRILSDADKSSCLKAIKKYNRWLLDKNIDRVYPETFLSQRRWENEFKL